MTMRKAIWCAIPVLALIVSCGAASEDKSVPEISSTQQAVVALCTPTVNGYAVDYQNMWDENSDGLWEGWWYYQNLASSTCFIWIKKTYYPSNTVEYSGAYVHPYEGRWMYVPIRSDLCSASSSPDEYMKWELSNGATFGAELKRAPGIVGYTLYHYFLCADGE
jgi:hypothetical protein